jgi:hypothetical protein
MSIILLASRSEAVQRSWFFEIFVVGIVDRTYVSTTFFDVDRTVNDSFFLRYHRRSSLRNARGYTLYSIAESPTLLPSTGRSEHRGRVASPHRLSLIDKTIHLPPDVFIVLSR